MKEIRIGKREIPLFYSTFEMIAIQREIGCTAFQLRDEVFGIVQEDEDDPMSVRLECVTDPEKTEKLGKLIRILGNAGLEEAGETPDLTDKWVMRAIRPAKIQDAMQRCLDAINDGMASEIPAKKSDEPVDVTLEQLEKKKEKDG